MNIIKFITMKLDDNSSLVDIILIGKSRRFFQNGQFKVIFTFVNVFDHFVLEFCKISTIIIKKKQNLFINPRNNSIYDLWYAKILIWCLMLQTMILNMLQTSPKNTTLDFAAILNRILASHTFSHIEYKKNINKIKKIKKKVWFNVWLIILSF